MCYGCEYDEYECSQKCPRMFDLIDAMPKVDAEPVIHAFPIINHTFHRAECSNCHNRTIEYDNNDTVLDNYCGYCGAKLDMETVVKLLL